MKLFEAWGKYAIWIYFSHAYLNRILGWSQTSNPAHFSYCAYLFRYGKVRWKVWLFITKSLVLGSSCKMRLWKKCRVFELLGYQFFNVTNFSKSIHSTEVLILILKNRNREDDRRTNAWDCVQDKVGNVKTFPMFEKRTWKARVLLILKQAKIGAQ